MLVFTDEDINKISNTNLDSVLDIVVKKQIVNNKLKEHFHEKKVNDTQNECYCEEECDCDCDSNPGEDRVYVISVNGNPYFFEEDWETAVEKINDITKLVNRINETQLWFKNRNEIHLYTEIDFYLFKVQYTSHIFKIHKLYNYKPIM